MLPLWTAFGSSFFHSHCLFIFIFVWLCYLSLKRKIKYQINFIKWYQPSSTLSFLLLNGLLWASFLMFIPATFHHSLDSCAPLILTSREYPGLVTSQLICIFPACSEQSMKKGSNLSRAFFKVSLIGLALEEYCGSHHLPSNCMDSPQRCQGD